MSGGELAALCVLGVVLLGTFAAMGLGLARAAARPVPKPEPDDLFDVARTTGGIDAQQCTYTEERATGLWRCTNPSHPDHPIDHWLQRTS